MSIDRDALKSVKLTRLSEGDPEQGLTLVELASMLAGDAFDAPPGKSISPVVYAFATVLNAALHDDAPRTSLLRPCAEGMVSTVGTQELERRRAYLCADAAVRVISPLKAEAEGRREDAQRLRALPPVTDEASAIAVTAALDGFAREHDFREARLFVAPARITRLVAQPGFDPRVVGGNAAGLFQEVSLTPDREAQLFGAGADLLHRLCALREDGSVPATSTPWSKLLAHLGLDEDSELVASSSDEALARHWNFSSDPVTLLKLWSRTEDRRSLVLAACACARTSLELINPDESRPRGFIETAEAWARGALSDEALFEAQARAYEAIPDESDADSAAIAAAREALETVRNPEKSWRAAKSAAEARAFKREEEGAADPFPSLLAEAEAHLARVVRESLPCPKLADLRTELGTTD